MYLLSGEKSVMSLIFPFGFWMKNAWQHHGVGSVTLVIMSWSISFLTYVSVWAWYRRGDCLVVDAPYGVIFVSFSSSFVV